MQQHNQRVEYVVKGNEVIQKGKEHESYERVPQADIAAAQVRIGEYDDGSKPKKKKKQRKGQEGEDQPDDQIVRKHQDIEEVGEDGYDNLEGNYLNQQQKIPAQKKKSKSSYKESEDTDPSTQWAENEHEHKDLDEGESKPKKKKSKKGKSKEGSDQQEGEQERSPDHSDDRELEESKTASKEARKEAKNKKKEEILRIKNQFMEKLISPFTQVEDLVEMFMKPLPKEVGILECSILRNKSGFNFWNPKYTLVISEGERFLLNGKKRGGNKTSNYMITLDQDGLKKKGKGYLGKLRSNFMGTEFIVYDQGKNPKEAKNDSEIRREYGSVLYEANVLGSKGPRKMRVMIPAIDKEDNICTWKPKEKGESMIEKYRDGKKDMMLIFHNKEPKWNETVQAYVLNFNGRVDQASVKNFQLIMSDENYIFMQFGKIGKNDFNMDVQWPLSIFQAYAIALSSIDKKFG